ncbi:MAG: DUF4364 family protein [Oscillospiraceae bacterium]|nr:DUF4364 family protein [Oscillospiraceae bacterium]
MPRYGFSGEPADMRKLVLLVCRTIGEPVDGRELIRLALIDENSDYFLFADALSALLENGLLERKGEAVCLSAKGEETAAVTERSLPAALRRAVAEESAAARERQLRGRCVSADAFENKGAAIFSGTLTDGAELLLELTLQAGGMKQAAALKRRFEKDAERILQRIWEVMTEA